MASTYELIASQTLGSDAATVSFSSIASTYDDLLIIISARSSRADTFEVAAARFNGAISDTNHSSRYLLGSGSAASSGTNTYCRLGLIPANSATASTFGNLEIYIPNYAGSANKSYSASSVMENNATLSYIDAIAGLWSDSSAITDIELRVILGSNYKSGSSFYLYGISHS